MHEGSVTLTHFPQLDVTVFWVFAKCTIINSVVGARACEGAWQFAVLVLAAFMLTGVNVIGVQSQI